MRLVQRRRGPLCTPPTRVLAVEAVRLPRSIFPLGTLQVYTLGGPFVTFPVFIVGTYTASSMIRALVDITLIIILDIKTRGWRRLRGSVF